MWAEEKNNLTPRECALKWLLVGPMGHRTGVFMQAEKQILDPVVKSRLHEGIVRQIQRKIIAGEFAIGQKLPPEREVAASLNVNRATLREALKKLEMQGLVEIRHGDGIYVRNYLESGNLELFRAMIYMNDVISIDLLKDILDIRKIIVPEMAEAAANRRSESELHKLEEAVAGANTPSMLERDLLVHHIIALASGNMFYTFILNFFNQLFRDYGYLYFSSAENQERSAKFHRDIFRAIKTRQGEKAKKIMRVVLEYTEQRIYEYYNDNASGLVHNGGVQ
ncbi:MAG TPA: FadR family transcriptional regulator [Spirochaetes bacterium]|nr:FadR family transcriptional regulator [Spirochaetota bacterium]